jgi:hypothetical protein
MISIRKNVDPDWKLASRFSAEGRQLAVDEGELIDCGHLDPLFADDESQPEPNQVKLPGDRG